MSTLTLSQKAFRTLWKTGAAALISLVLISGALAWVSSDFQGLTGWLSFGAVVLIGMGILTGGWFALRASEPEALPSQLAQLLIFAALLRLGMGVFWYIALPDYGHGSPLELAGYIQPDAYARDTAAWKLAESDRPLTAAFGGYPKADQYGGLLFVSALIYRYLGGESHLPLMMVVIASSFSGLSVLFAWGLARRAWGEKAAVLTAWGLTLYPEAVHLGSSQMREAFMITLTAASFYGLIRYSQNRSLLSTAWILLPFLLFIPISPPIAVLLLGGLLLAAAGMGLKLPQSQQKKRLFWVLLVLIVLVVIAGAALALARFAPEGVSNPILYWIVKSAQYQAHRSEVASGWVQKYFRRMPEELHIPFLVGYGVLRPLLPAAIIDLSESPLWYGITLWRSLGWTILLAFLVYAPLRVLTRGDSDRFTRALILVVWVMILVASFRSGGDPDDNPRYRATFSSLQIGLAAWVWVAQQKNRDIWLRRALVSMGLVMAWLIPWYLRRYTAFDWPVIDLFKTLGLGAASALLYFIWDWARTEEKPDPPGTEANSGAGTEDLPADAVESGA